MLGPLEVSEKFRWVGGGGLLEYSVYLSPLKEKGERRKWERRRREERDWDNYPEFVLKPLCGLESAKDFSRVLKIAQEYSRVLKSALKMLLECSRVPKIALENF